MKTKSQFAAPSAPPDRARVRADYVAQAVGMSLSRIENHFRPADWATPRDFIFTRTGGLLYAVESLPRLAVELEVAGETQAAELLRRYFVTVSNAAQPDYAAISPALAQVLESRPVAVERVEGTAEELDAAAARHGRRHASEREELPRSWVSDWEARHE